ncbi:transposase [Holospora undulata]|uniref:transposase n=1 Tax=Holospora undulata TaxID=1169117 RepID=UPI003898D8C6
MLPNLPKESGSVWIILLSIKEKLCKRCHSLLYLPFYSPDLNPIEKKWAQAKHIRRTSTCSIDHLFQFHFS